MGGCSKNNENSSSSENKTQSLTVTFDFKGVKLGQSVEEVKKIFNWKYAYNTSIEANDYYVICDEKGTITKCENIQGLTIANQIPKEVSFLFENKKLTTLKITFNDSYFDDVSNALSKKYGEPTTEIHVPLSNKFTGAPSEGIVVDWKNVTNDSILITNHEKEGSNYIPQGTFMMFSKPKADAIEAPPDV
jgi:hypothetical protein